MSEAKKQIQTLFRIIMGIAVCGGIFTIYLIVSRYFPSVYIFCDVSPQEKCLNVYKLLAGTFPIEIFGVFVYGVTALCTGLLAHGFIFQKFNRFLSAKRAISFLHFLLLAALGGSGYVLFLLFGRERVFSWPPFIHAFLILILWIALLYASLRIKKTEQETKTCDFC